jgi:hypothetical protein
VLLCSSLVYYSEKVHSELIEEPPFPSDFQSIPGTFWWCIVTLMTVGYGDQVPSTAMGKVVAGFAMVCAVVLMALPISVIGTQFTQHWVTYKRKDKRDARTAVAFTTLAELVDNLSDHIKVCKHANSIHSEHSNPHTCMPQVVFVNTAVSPLQEHII